MNKTDRLILGLATGITLCLCFIAGRLIYSRNHPKPPDSVEISISREELLGPHPDFRGDPKAGFTLVEFADFQCPACAAVDRRLKELLRIYEGKLNIRFRHYPLSSHRDSMRAAEAAEGARIQGRFWSIHDALFSAQGSLDAEAIRSIVQRSGLGIGRSDHHTKESAKAAIEYDIALAERLSVKGTPTLFLCLPSGRVWRLGWVNQAEAFLKDMSTSAMSIHKGI